MFLNNNAFRILPVTIARVMVSLLQNGAEHRMWVTGNGTIALTYRDPAGHLIAVTEDWSQPHATRLYHACDTMSERGPKSRRVGAHYGSLCNCQDDDCSSRHQDDVR